MINVANTSSLVTLKIDIYGHQFIKNDIFKATVTFPPIGTPVGIVAQYCEHHNTSYVSQSKISYRNAHSLQEIEPIMDSKNRYKRSNNSTTSNGMHIKSTAHRHMQ